MLKKDLRMPSNPSPESKLDFKRILPIFVIVLIDLLGLTIIIPLLPLYAASFGASPLTIGALGATYPILQFVGAPLLGRLSDRYGRRPVLLVSQLGTLLGFILLGLADAMWLLFISRVIDGISGANISTAQAAISDSTTEENRTQGLGLVGAAFGLGFIIGPVIAFVALAVSGNDYHFPAYVAAGFSLISILLTYFWLEETLPKEKRGVDTGRASISIQAMLAALKRPQVGALLTLVFMQQLAFGNLEQLLSLFTLNRIGLNASGNAVIFVFVGLVLVVVQGRLIGPWSRRLGDRRLVTMGLALLTLGLLMAAFTPTEPVPWYSRAELEAELGGNENTRSLENPTTQEIAVSLPQEGDTGWLGLIWFVVAMVPAAIGGGVLQPSLNSLISRSVPQSEVGGMLGISSAFLSGANAVAPLIGGAIFQWLGAPAPFLLSGVIMAGLIFYARRRIESQPKTEST
jgi:DHA1 family tetracycline resistance protein-like MFS transporter